MDASVRGIESRLASLRGRLAASRAAEDLQAGFAAGAGLALLLGLLRWLGLPSLAPSGAAGAGVCLALAFPAAGVLLRRTTARGVANLVDERLGLAERVSTALSLRSGESAAPFLGALVLEDASRSLDAVDRGTLRRAFRPKLAGRPLLAGLGAGLLAVVAFRMDPVERREEKPKDPAAAFREKEEKADAAKAARKLLEEARKVEDTADPRHAALVAVAAEMRRQAEALLRQNPPKAEAMAAFQRMGELARERQELLAGLSASALKEMRAGGGTSKSDPALEKLLGKLLGSDLKGLNESLSNLDRDLKGLEGAGEWTSESLAALKEKIDALAEALKKGEGGLEGREALKKSLGVLGDPALLKEISERLSKLMETLRAQGWEGCKSQKGLDPGAMKGFDPGEPITLSDEQLQAMIERLKELQELADLGQLAFCKNCGLSGGT
jgi:hypothetical protein